MDKIINYPKFNCVCTSIDHYGTFFASHSSTNRIMPLMVIFTQTMLMFLNGRFNIVVFTTTDGYPHFHADAMHTLSLSLSLLLSATMCQHICSTNCNEITHIHNPSTQEKVPGIFNIKLDNNFNKMFVSVKDTRPTVLVKPEERKGWGLGGWMVTQRKSSCLYWSATFQLQ